MTESATSGRPRTNHEAKVTTAATVRNIQASA
jgi:hypothetical protein